MIVYGFIKESDYQEMFFNSSKNLIREKVIDEYMLFKEQLKKLKAKEYFEITKKFLEQNYKMKFRKEEERYRASCPHPLHKDKNPSFVLYLSSYDGKPSEVRMHCFGKCNFPRRDFDIFDLVKELDHCSLYQAYKKVKSFFDKYSVKLDHSEEFKSHPIDKGSIYKINKKAALLYHHILLSFDDEEVKEAKEYLRERGIGLREIKKYMLGYAPKLGSKIKGLSWYFRKDFVRNWPLYEKTGLFTYLGRKNLKTYINKEYFIDGPSAYYGDFLSRRITIPIIDEKGRVVGLQGRKVGKCKKKGRYLLTKGTPRGEILFGFHQNYDHFKKHEMYEINGQYERVYWWNQIYIVEGAFDVMCADSFFNVIPGGCPFVATLGGPLTSNQVNILARNIENLQWPRIILFFDGGGEKFTLESYRALQKNPITKTLPIGFKLLPKGMDPADYYTGSKGSIAKSKKENELDKKIYPLYTLELPVSDYIDLIQLMANGEKSSVMPYWVDKEKLIFLLSENKKGLSRYSVPKYLERIVKLICEDKVESKANAVDIPTTFVAPETVKATGGALILLLDLWIQQREKKRVLKASAKEEMKRLRISKRTYFKYQKILIDLGFIKKEKNKLKVVYSPKNINIHFNDIKQENEI